MMLDAFHLRHEGTALSEATLLWPSIHLACLVVNGACHPIYEDWHTFRHVVLMSLELPFETTITVDAESSRCPNRHWLLHLPSFRRHLENSYQADQTLHLSFLLRLSAWLSTKFAMDHLAYRKQDCSGTRTSGALASTSKKNLNTLRERIVEINFVFPIDTFEFPILFHVFVDKCFFPIQIKRF